MAAPNGDLSVIPDHLDRQIIHAIRVDPRLSFAVVAQALDVSEQTIARRFRRMESSGLMRVVGLAVPEARGYQRWILRIQCRPDAASMLAEALARRVDVSWVSLSAGGSEILCLTWTRRETDAQDLLLHRLPRTAEVRGLSAFSILHQFGVDTEWTGYGGELTPEQLEILTRAATAPVEVESPVPIDDDDQVLLSALARDGRASLRRLSAQTGWSSARVARRLEQLQHGGAIFFDVDLDVGRLGFDTSAMLWMTVAPSDLAAVGQALTTHDEVAFSAAVTGSANLIASVMCRNPAGLYSYLTTRIAALPAVRQIETSLMLRRFKAAGSILTPTGVAVPSPPR